MSVSSNKFAVFCLIPVICLGAERARTESNTRSSRMVEVADGVSLRVIEAGKPGDGPALVFIPGWSTGGDIWHHQVDTFAKNHRVIAFDPRSQGESTKTTSGNTPEMCAGPPAAVHNLSGRNSPANFLGKISRAMRRNFSLCCRMESATTNRANRATAFMRNFRAMDASAWWKRSIGCLPRGSALITRTS